MDETTLYRARTKITKPCTYVRSKNKYNNKRNKKLFLTLVVGRVDFIQNVSILFRRNWRLERLKVILRHKLGNICTT